MNKNENCEKWAGLGDCEKNVLWMKNNCALACRTCDAAQVGVAHQGERGQWLPVNEYEAKLMETWERHRQVLRPDGPRYDACDGRPSKSFYTWHDPKSTPLMRNGLQHFNVQEACSKLPLRTLMVGDSISRLMAVSMAVMLGGEQIKQKEMVREPKFRDYRMNFDAYAVCEGSKNVTWIRNDLMEPMTREEYRRAGLPREVDKKSATTGLPIRVLVSCAHLVEGVICSDWFSFVKYYDLLILNSGLHPWKRSNGMFGDEVAAPDIYKKDWHDVARIIAQHRSKGQRVIFRTSSPGHSGCQNKDASVHPFASIDAADKADAANPWYRSRLLPTLNAHMKAAAKANGFDVLDVYESGLLARQRHCARKMKNGMDCLHYCVSRDAVRMLFFLWHLYLLRSATSILK